MDNRMDFAPCGYIKLTPQGIIKEVNYTFLAMTGYGHEDLLEMHFESFLSLASKIIFHSLFFPQVCLKGGIDELYLTIKNKNKEEMSVLLIGNMGENNKGETVDCVIVRADKRDNYEEELQDIKERLEEAYITENKLRKLFETTLFSINEGLIVTDNDGAITIINDLAEAYTGWSKKLALGKKIDQVLNCISSTSKEKRSDIVPELLKSGKKKETFDQLILISKDGTEKYISGTVGAIVSMDGKTSGVVFSFRDITKEYLQEKEIDSFLNINMEMLCVIDQNGNFHKINKKFEKILGYTSDDIIGKNFLLFVHPEDILATSEEIRNSCNSKEISVFTNRYQCKDGAYKYIEWYRQFVAGRYTYSSARDVTEKMEKEAQLLNIAVRDELTGLYNRHFLVSYLKNEIEKAEAEDQPMTMAILDLDQFKLVNDTWGHPVGDEQLKHTAKTILRVIRSTDLLVRYGGEELVIIMEKTNIDDAKIVLEKIRMAIENNQYPITGRQTVSIGAAERAKSELFVDWYKRADQALYHAKNRGRNRVICSNQ